MKEALGDKVEKVAVSARLTDAPACITTEGPLSLEMEKVLQKGPEGAPDGMPKSQRVLELNAKHPVFSKLVAAQKAGDADKIKQYLVCSMTVPCWSRAFCPRTPLPSQQLFAT